MGHWEPSRPGSMGGLHCPAPGPWASHLIGLCRHEDPHPQLRRGSVRIHDDVCKVPSTCLGHGGLPACASLPTLRRPRPAALLPLRPLRRPPTSPTPDARHPPPPPTPIFPQPCPWPPTSQPPPQPRLSASPPLLSASPNPPSTQASPPDSTAAAPTPDHPPTQQRCLHGHALASVWLRGVQGCIRERRRVRGGGRTQPGMRAGRACVPGV